MTLLHQYEREVHTYADLKHGADVLFKKSKSDERGSYYTDMAALLLTAFTFEAYLNHLLVKKTTFAEQIETISVANKYLLICKILNHKTDPSRRPHQTIHSLFKFRNAIAHGKSTVISGSGIVENEQSVADWNPLTHWEEYCTHENVARALEDIELAIIELHKVAGLGSYPFRSGLTVTSLTHTDDAQDD